MIVIRDPRPFDEVAARVSEALAVPLHAHESSYWGDPYYAGPAGSDLKLTRNKDPQYRDGDPPEERFFLPVAEDANFVLWNADSEADALDRLRAGGFDAEIVAPA